MSPLWRGSRVQHLRLASGLVLAAFVATHLINHALGLISLDAMEWFQTLRIAVTRSWAGTAVLGAALGLHLALAGHKLAQKSSWRMPPAEAAQIASGVLIPLLLIDHLVATRLAATLYGTADFYRPMLAFFWSEHRLVQTALLIVAWTHVTLGLSLWLRTVKVYKRFETLLLLVAILLPLLALLGIVVGTREATRDLTSDAARMTLAAQSRWPEAEAMATLNHIRFWLYSACAAALFALASVQVRRQSRTRRSPTITITYDGNKTITAPIGLTLLDISRTLQVPHVSVCGGRARCSTCRVRIERGLATLAPAERAEAATLEAIRAPANVRLACQIRPTEPLSVTRLIAPTMEPQQLKAMPGAEAEGVERTLAVLFIDVRNFTARSEQKLPYDIVYLLNRFFLAIGNAVQAHGGLIANYTGDGLVAVFGRESSPQQGCRHALAASAAIETALDALNRDLGREKEPPLEVGMGLHAGPLVFGRIGHPDMSVLTVIGSVANTAARLESLSKDFACRLVVSTETLRIAALNAENPKLATVTVRGQTQAITVLKVAHIGKLKLSEPRGAQPARPPPKPKRGSTSKT